jgi:xylose isomerase
MDRLDLFHAHIGGIDTLARSLLVAAALIEAGTVERLREERYAGWSGELGRSILGKTALFEMLAGRVLTGEIDPKPVSGRQELLENVVNQGIWSADQAARVETGTGR